MVLDRRRLGKSPAGRLVGHHRASVVADLPAGGTRDRRGVNGRVVALGPIDQHRQPRSRWCLRGRTRHVPRVAPPGPRAGLVAQPPTGPPPAGRGGRRPAPRAGLLRAVPSRSRVGRLRRRAPLESLGETESPRSRLGTGMKTSRWERISWRRRHAGARSQVLKSLAGKAVGGARASCGPKTMRTPVRTPLRDELRDRCRRRSGGSLHVVDQPLARTFIRRWIATRLRAGAARRAGLRAADSLPAVGSAAGQAARLAAPECHNYVAPALSRAAAAVGRITKLLVEGRARLLCSKRTTRSVLLSR